MSCSPLAYLDDFSFKCRVNQKSLDKLYEREETPLQGDEKAIDTDTDSTSDDYCYSEDGEPDDEDTKGLDDPDIEEESKFHMIAKKVFLTYSQANHLTIDLLKERLLSINVAIYVFSQENHKLPPLEDDEIENSDNDSDFDEFEGYYPKITKLMTI